MVNYDYLCKQEECGFRFERKQSIKDESLKECPECKSSTLIRVIHSPITLIKAEAKTVGLLAEHNNQRLGHNEIEERESKNRENKELAKLRLKEELEAKLPAGASIPNTPQQKEQWFRPGTTGANMKLANLTPKQTEKFIKEGAYD